MVKPLVKRLAGGAFLAWLALCCLSCGASLMTEQYVPWYASLIQRSVSFGDYLPAQYRNNRIAVRALSGPDAANPTGATATWLVFFQDRSPEASEILIMDNRLNVVLQLASVTASNDPRRWLVDVRGRILLGGQMIAPPAVAGGAWAWAASPDSYRAQGSLAWLAVPGTSAGSGRNYPVQVSVSLGSGDLLLGSADTGGSYQAYADADWNWHANPLATSPALTVLRSRFLQTYYPQLFPGQGWTSGSYSPPVSCLGAQTDWASQQVSLFCTMDASGLLPLFVITLPLVNLENVSSSNVRITVLKSGDTSPFSAAFDPFESQVVARASGGYLCSLPRLSGGSSGADRKPLVANRADGTASRRLEIAIPRYVATDGSSFNPGSSSISQQAFLLPGFDWWLAVDGFTRKLYVCSPWWD
jgi:hypothetical protein